MKQENIRIQKRRIIFLLFMVIVFYSQITNAQSIRNNKYGKNRIQYKKFNWQYISSQNFDIYFYEGGYQIAQLTAEYAEADFPKTVDLIGFSPYSKIQIFVYHSITDLQQSNIGINDQNYSVGGQTDFVKSEIQVAFSGSKVSYRQILKRKIAEILISEMMYGGNWRDILQNSYLLNLPEWFMAGAAEYASKGWNAEMDNFMRDLFLHQKVKKLDILSGKKAMYVGQSIWNFIAQEYGAVNMAGILNLTRIIKNEEASIQNTLGIPYAHFIENWKRFYKEKYEKELEKYEQVNDKNRVNKNDKSYIYSFVKLSPDQKHLAFSENLNGSYVVKIKNLKTGKTQKVLKGGYKVLNQNIDYQIPVFEWKNNHELFVINHVYGKHFIHSYHLQTKRKTRFPVLKFAHILDFDVSKDEKKLVMSAERNGQCDLYLYDLTTHQSQKITDDIYEEITPTFIKESNEIIYSSNRLVTGDKLYIPERFNLFIYNPETQKSQRITNTLSKDAEPVSISKNDIIFKSNVQGVVHLYHYQRDLKVSSQISAYHQNIKTFDWVKDRPVYVMFYRGREHIFYDAPYHFSQTKFTPQTVQKMWMDKQLLHRKKHINLNHKPLLKTEIKKPYRKESKNGYNFEVIEQPSSQYEKPRHSSNKPLPYKNRFGIDNVVWSPAIDPLRNLGLVFETEMTDILENHKLNIGAFNLMNFRNFTYFIEYEYLKKRLDYRVRIDRVTLMQGNLPNFYFTHNYALNKLQGSVSIPFNITTRLTAAPFLASTVFNPSSNVDPQVQKIPTENVYYAGINLEFVYDNSLITGINTSDGIKFRMNYENYIGLSHRNKSFGNINIDARFYKKINKSMTLASRLTYGRFLGKAKKNFRLGGVNNWAFYKTDIQSSDPYILNPDLPEKDYSDLLFVQYITNLRGFNYNKLYGNNYILWNTELRVPLLKYFYKSSITSNFFRNLQLVTFADIGVAWTGLNPFRHENALNTYQGQKGPFSYRVSTFKNPFLAGTGFGVRTIIIGFYVKLDVAWSIEDKAIHPINGPKYYLSLGYDF